MKSYSLIAPGKINLYLEIIGDRADGFHELVMILQSIELADVIDLKSNDTQGITLHCNHSQVPVDETNLAYRAAQLMCTTFADSYANYGGVDITIAKNLPVAAGLAGGSADAAAVLVGMDLMWNLGLTQPELQDLAAKLGSDVPFCISGGTAIATGRGEKLDLISNLNSLWVILAKYKNLSVSTPWAYQTYRKNYRNSYVSDVEGIISRSDRVRSGDLMNAIVELARSLAPIGGAGSLVKQKGRKIGELLYNDLEKVVLPEYPKVAELRDIFADKRVLGTMMSGSGPTVFALCENEDQAEEVANQVRDTIVDSDLELWVTKLGSSGIQVA